MLHASLSGCWCVLVQTVESTSVHLGILTSFQLRLREALRWVRALPGKHTLRAHLEALHGRPCGQG